MNRRLFLASAATLPLGMMRWPFSMHGMQDSAWRSGRPETTARSAIPQRPAESRETTLFLCGDVMTGRGIDQVLSHPSDPRLYEPYVRSATTYVELAEEASGSIPKPVADVYIWGEALEELERVAPDARIINLETSVTTSDTAWPGKGINYRMHPDNIGCIASAGIDCCVLSNNHVMDWGHDGLHETLETLHEAGIRTAGAGLDAESAAAPAVLEEEGGRRVFVFGLGSTTSGIPGNWAARPDRPGVNFLPALSPEAADRFGERVRAVRRDGDIVIASIHWGDNWGYEVPRSQREFAHRLIEEAGVDVVHGHSSHHFKGVEVHQGRPILYGCGDFITDYEGISGNERYRDDLVLMYFPTLDGATGSLLGFRLTPLRLRRFRLERPDEEDVTWVRDTLNREGERFGTRVEDAADGSLNLSWT